MNFAKVDLAHSNHLENVQASLQVSLIMVPRHKILTCKMSETHENIRKKNVENFSYIPVEDSDQKFIGMYFAEEWFNKNPPEGSIENCLVPLSEANVIGANTSIFDFIVRGNSISTCLVVSGSKIVGLVSVSDIQQLPVRAALFSLITDLEMAMVLRINHYWQEGPEPWLKLIGPKEAEKIRTERAKGKAENTNIDPIFYTTLHQKEKISIKAGFFDIEESWDKHLTEIRNLRNDLAHAKPYAKGMEEAKRVCELVALILEAKRILLEPLKLRSSSK